MVSTEGVESIKRRALYAGYALSLAVSISLWLLAFRSPLDLDETGSFWQISAGFSRIWPRQGLDFPGYSYLLWLTTKILGTSEIAMRIPSVLAMLAASFLLYRVARKLFPRDVAIVAVAIFCLNPAVIYASIDVRPYAFAVLMANAAILALFRLRDNDSNRSAALLGFLAASILYFHYLFGVILPALAICFLLIKRGNRPALWRQGGIALGAFALGFLPVIPGLEYVFRTRATHVYASAPKLGTLIWTLAPRFLVIGLVITGLAALLVAGLRTQQRGRRSHLEGEHVLLCLTLALVPILILYGVSVGTSMHVFLPRYRLAAISGIALCWALAIGLFDSRVLRLVFCLALAMTTAHAYLATPSTREHGNTWKYALEVAEKNASPRNTPVLICSDFIESNHALMPFGSAKESALFAPLSYYKISVPVVPLPKALNGEAVRVATAFLRKATQQHERFLAVADRPSYRTLDWIAKRASREYHVRKLGVFEAIKVLEFVPRAGASRPR